MKSKAGELYIVATPIGNLADISYRAVDILRQVDLILAEDTRNSVKLLQHYAIHQPMKALHEHNEAAQCEKLVAQLLQGRSMALISDAGTPLLSDPGYALVRAAQQAGIQAQAVPGACAAIAALSVSGLATDRFLFEGFLPARESAREQRLKSLSGESATVIFYEARHRIVGFLNSLQKVFGGERRVAVARELTKKFETVYHGSLAEVSARIAADNQAQKGEFVVLVAGSEAIRDEGELERVLAPLVAEFGVARASKLAAKITGINKNRCYERALQLQR